MKLKEFKADLIPKGTGKLDIYTKRKVLNEVLAGEWISQLKRRGIEFAGYRAYTVNDDAKLIDWKASLRANKLLVKELEIERAHNIFFLVDVSDSMLFASTKKLKCEYAAEVISSIAFAILRGGDNVGMALFSDRLVEKIYPQVGRRQYYRIVKSLSEPSLYGGNFDFEKAIKYAISFLHMRATIVLVSDFIGLKPNWKDYIEFLAQRYNVVAIMIRDPRDEEIPESIGQMVIEDVYTKEKMYIDTKEYAKKYNKEAKEEKQKIELVFENLNVPFLELRTDEDFFDKTIMFFRKGEHKWT